ncbi:ribonuclease P protein component [Labedella phragmitis]|uniref:Ribonuclease P protein component n=1 Tax=Labedella phragmitis TaxID=2498849 RepID=A0A3S4DIX7_9MICO|nr:ribonuclease P protein component [Labedella phragmitis]RWZ52589.1 ribonuclease P protein component [Labedella phragmitis]
MLAKVNRIAKADDYRAVVRRGRRVVSENTVSYVSMNPNGGPPRFGFIVAKTVGNAVVRNTVRRRLKAASFSALARTNEGTDIVIRALPPAAGAPYAALVDDVERAITTRAKAR